MTIAFERFDGVIFVDDAPRYEAGYTPDLESWLDAERDGEYLSLCPSSEAAFDVIVDDDMEEVGLLAGMLGE